jgi:hypothetical protein
LFIKLFDFYSDEPRIVFFFNAETVLHDYWGNDEYWKARRSMRFNNYLVQEANKYRLDHFSSANNLDEVQRPDSWLSEKVCFIIVSLKNQLLMLLNFVSHIDTQLVVIIYVLTYEELIFFMAEKAQHHHLLQRLVKLSTN